MSGDPFRALGLPTGPVLTDDDVRAAWRRVAAATHPDRGDGGDPAAFAAAAAAYSDLRTPFGRGEALADLAAPALGGQAVRGTGPGAAARQAASGPVHNAGGGVRMAAAPAHWATRWAARVRRGRPARLALRVLAAAAASALVLAVAGWRPASPALIIGALTWVIRSGRHDLAAGPSRPRPVTRPGQPVTAVTVDNRLFSVGNLAGSLGRLWTNNQFSKGRRVPSPAGGIRLPGRPAASAAPRVSRARG